MSLTSLLDYHGIQWRTSDQHKNVRNGFIGVHCPYCYGTGKSGGFHLGISERSLGVNCWRCGKLKIWDVLRSLGCTPEEIKSLFDDKVVAPKLIRPKGKLKEPKDVGPLSKAHIAYLRGRGMKKAQAELWGLKGIGRLGGRYAWRIFVPIIWQGETVSWTTRAINDKQLRWDAATAEQERIPASDVLYGWDFVSDAAILVEGPGDCWRGGPGFVCSMGMKLSSKQLELLSSVPKRGICLDKESNARRKALNFAEQLSALPGETIVCTLEHGSDPGDAPESELEELRREILR